MRPYLQVVGCLHFCVHGALEGRGVGGSLLQPLYKFNVQNKKKENKIKLNITSYVIEWHLVTSKCKQELFSSSEKICASMLC